jgi:hypothetical protein
MTTVTVDLVPLQSRRKIQEKNFGTRSHVKLLNEESRTVLLFQEGTRKKSLP